MAIEQILQKIEDDAAEAARAVIAEAEAEAQRIAARAEADAGALRAELEALADRKAEEETRRLIVGAQLETRKAELVRKRELLGEVYDEARRAIAGLSGDEYLGLLASMIAARAVSGREEIVPAAGQRDLLDGAFLARVGEAFRAGAAFTVAAEEGPFDWGVVLREGRRTVDLSLETVFEQVRERIEPEVSAILFGGPRKD